MMGNQARLIPCVMMTDCLISHEIVEITKKKIDTLFKKYFFKWYPVDMASH